MERASERELARVAAIDFVRGLVMVLMTLDHASSAFNGGRLMVDGAAMFRADMVLDPLQFVVRWVTHLCAPTFVLLAGVSLALSVARRQRDRMAAWRIDRDILIRGTLLIGLDAAWMGWMWRFGPPIQLGVLYAIGVSMIGLIVVRRLPPAVVAVLGIVILTAGEAVTSQLDPASPLVAATLTGGRIGAAYILYPFLPWTGFLLVGWALGARLARSGMRARDWLALAAIAAVTFAVVRGVNGYGNAHLLRRDGAWIEWLHVSKYPPSLSYAALELAIAFALLALAWRATRLWQPLILLGQTALFYYLLHAHLLHVTAAVFGVHRSLGLGAVGLAWLAALVVLYPACRWYLGVKRRHPTSVLRFV